MTADLAPSHATVAAQKLNTVLAMNVQALFRNQWYDQMGRLADADHTETVRCTCTDFLPGKFVGLAGWCGRTSRAAAGSS
jgi:hypothetical protein